MASQVIQASAGLADQTGRGYQQHLAYLNNAGKWLLAWQDSSDAAKLKFLYNGTTDFTAGSWSVPTGSPYTLAASFSGDNTHRSGCSHHVFYKDIGGNDVLHIDQVTYDNGLSRCHYNHLRGHFSGTTLTIDSDPGATNNEVLLQTGTPPLALGCSLNPQNRPLVWGENAGGSQSANQDLGTSWTDDSSSAFNYSQTESPSNLSMGGCIVPVGVFDAAISLFSDGSDATPTPLKNIHYSKYFDGPGWGTAQSVGFSALGAGVSANDFGAVGVNSSDVHCVLRTGSNTYSHRRYNGTSWSAGQAIPNQNSKAGAGLCLLTNGTDAWLCIIDSDAANTVRAIKWTAATPAWDATWTAIESTTKTRNALSGYQLVASGHAGLIWTETNGGTFDIVGTTFTATSAAGSTPPFCGMLMLGVGCM